ncbi:hypothetical protein [Wolbachia endosymbiont of Tribolium confusum]|uniref:hypothetical protein n=1 Tax=Wolbachia endosymbiont of Tribolium confusum TaxID=214474 RepID=UPI001CF165B2|nr:hypothetical protein [Wolbachia endosymbiont of Tribolium confusum]MCA7010880.1 hypothetical protein [Wolbachia endosymbiont of Tribolium confusum]
MFTNTRVPDSKLAGSGNGDSSRKTVAILLLHHLTCIPEQVSQGMLASNYVHNYGQFIQWGIYNNVAMQLQDLK